jgi:hypothetical protein
METRGFPRLATRAERGRVLDGFAAASAKLGPSLRLGSSGEMINP